MAGKERTGGAELGENVVLGHGAIYGAGGAPHKGAESDDPSPSLTAPP